MGRAWTRVEVRVLLHIYMVAGSYWPPALRAGGLRVDPWALGPTFVDMTDELNKTAASLPLWKDEKPTTGEVRKWLEDAEPLLTAPQRALINGVEPASHVKYRPVSVPPLLVVSAADGVTAAMVATNDRAIQTALDTNAERAATKDAANAEISSGLFAALERAVQPNAPLLLTELKASCKQAAPFDAYYDGKAAWQALKAMSEADAALPGEDNVHDAHFTKLIISPLPNDATPAQFSARVSTAMKYHAPYLSRPFPTPKALSQWVVRQTPEKHRHRAQDRFDALTAAEQNNAHGVAAMIVKLLAESRPMSAMLKDSDLKEFVGVADDDDGANSGRRPSGLGKGKGGGGGGGGGGGKGGRGGRGGGGKGSGGGGGGTSGRGRATGCSTPPPRGPTCDHAHHGECWRDPKVTKIPQRVFDDARAIAKIKADRIVQGNRLGETVAELTPIAPTEEVVAMVDQADAIFYGGGQSGRLQSCLYGDYSQSGIDVEEGATTPILEALIRKEIVGGSSAGAMNQPMSEILVTGHSVESYAAVSAGEVFQRNRGNMMLESEELVDSHFSERGRQGRGEGVAGGAGEGSGFEPFGEAWGLLFVVCVGGGRSAHPCRRPIV